MGHTHGCRGQSDAGSEALRLVLRRVCLSPLILGCTLHYLPTVSHVLHAHSFSAIGLVLHHTRLHIVSW